MKKITNFLDRHTMTIVTIILGIVAGVNVAISYRQYLLKAVLLIIWVLTHAIRLDYSVYKSETNDNEQL